MVRLLAIAALSFASPPPLSAEIDTYGVVLPAVGMAARPAEKQARLNAQMNSLSSELHENVLPT